jgi:hypothetical protein
LRQKNFTLPCRFPIGPVAMALCVHVTIVFEGDGLLWTSQ